MENNNKGEKDEMTLEQDFVQATTLHGVARIAGHSRPLWIRAAWALAFGACMGVCFWQIYLRINAYISYDVNTKVTRLYSQDLDFPAVTICNFNRYRFSELTEDDLPIIAFVLFAFEFDNYGEYSSRDDFDYTDIFGDSTFNYTEFTLRAGFVLDNKTLIECKWRGRDCSAKDFTHVFTSYGNCYTFNGGADPTKPVLKQDQPGSENGLKVTVNIQQDEYTELENGNNQAGLKVLVHDQADPPLMDTLGSAVPPGYQSFIAVRKEQPTGFHVGVAFGTSAMTYSGPVYYSSCIYINFLGNKIKLCFNIKDVPKILRFKFKNLEGPWGKCDKKRTLQYYDEYTVSGCFLECRLREVINQCGCRPVSYPGDATVCSPLESSTCVKDTLRRLKSGSHGKCDCITPCSYVQYTSFISYASIPNLSVAAHIANQSSQSEVDYRRTNYIELDIFYQDLSYQLYEEQKALTISSLISDIGGNIGLFLGGSLLFFAELVDYIFMRIRGVCRRSERKHVMNTNPQDYLPNPPSIIYDHNVRMQARLNPMYIPEM